jgi:hypothetical protein
LEALAAWLVNRVLQVGTLTNAICRATKLSTVAVMGDALAWMVYVCVSKGGRQQAAISQLESSVFAGSTNLDNFA